MEYIIPETPIAPANPKLVFCRRCSSIIKPNLYNRCYPCSNTKFDLAEGIARKCTLLFCQGCERYLQPPSKWIVAPFASRELLELCLKKIKGLNKVKVIEAGFPFTERHSKRLMVSMKIEGGIGSDTILVQHIVIEFTIQNHMCDVCNRARAQDYWCAMVQVRPRANNRKTFYYLEQLILKHKAHENTLGIKPKHDGLDFFYASERHARKMVDFIQTVLPVKVQHSKKLISHDIQNNIYNYKFTFSIEIISLSKDSVVCLPKKLTQQFGGISPVCLVHRITSTIHLIDASTGQVGDIPSTVYWRSPFTAICNPKQLVEYIVMDIDVLKEHEKKSFSGQGLVSNKHVIADVWVVKASELGLDDNPVHTKTHLGHILKPGDTVLGYNIGDLNVNDTNFNKLDRSAIPDVLLVKKFYGEKLARRRARAWKLKHMAEELHEGPSCTNEDYNEFLDDLEEDPAFRQNVNIYKDDKKVPVDTDEIDPMLPRITLAEMLDDLCTEDAEVTDV